MGYLNITNMEFQEAGSRLEDPFVLDVKFDCMKDLSNRVEWRLLFVANPDDASQDQLLDSIEMAELEYGPKNFEWEVPAPDYRRLANPFDVFDTSVVMVVVLVDNFEFFRCSYLLSHEYETEELRENPPERIDWTALRRNLKTSNPVINVREVAWEELKSAKDSALLGDDAKDPRSHAFDIMADNN